MSLLSILHNLTNNVGRGAEDLFTLGGTELARKFGGQGAKNILDPLSTALGANFEAGAVGGSGIMGANALGMGGAGGMTPYMPTSAPNMGAAGSTLGTGGASSPLSLGGYGQTSGMDFGGTPTAAGTSPVMKALQMMRGGGPGQQQSGPSHQDVMTRLYQMFPSLRPGSQMGQGIRGF